jgi:hypothetical protein
MSVRRRRAIAAGPDLQLGLAVASAHCMPAFEEQRARMIKKPRRWLS